MASKGRICTPARLLRLYLWLIERPVRVRPLERVLQRQLYRRWL